MVTIQVPFVLVYFALLLAAGWLIYEIGDLVLWLWEKHQCKKRLKQTAEWLGKWGA